MIPATCQRPATHAARSRPATSGFATIGTLILATVSAWMLVLMSGCHSTPTTHAFAATDVDRAVEARLRQTDSMSPLQPFDEHLGPEPVEAD